MDINELDKGLIIEPVEYAKEASVKMPLDETLWPAAIQKAAHDEIPELDTVDYEVVMKKVDSEKAYGYGHLQSDQFSIPFIIKEGKMAPLDVFISTDKKAFPVKGPYLSRMTDNRAMDLGVVAPKNLKSTSPSIRKGVDSPDYTGSGSVRGAGGYSSEMPVFASEKSFLGGLHKDPVIVEKLASELRSNPSILAGYLKNETKDVLKLALQKGAAVDPPGAEDAFSGRKKSPAQGPGETVADPEAQPAEEVVDDGQSAPINESGRYTVIAEDGNSYLANVFTNVVDFKLKTTGLKVVSGFTPTQETKAKKDMETKSDDVSSTPMINVHQSYSVQTDVSGTASDDQIDSHSSDYPSKGDIGCFYLEKNGQYVLLQPVKIGSKTEYKNEQNVSVRSDDGVNQTTNQTYTDKEYTVTDMLGNEHVIMVSTKNKGMNVSGGIVQLSSMFSFMRLGSEFVKVSSNASIDNKKVAFANENNPVTIKASGTHFSIHADWSDEKHRGGVFVKSASEYLKKYYKNDSVADILKLASKKGSIKIKYPKFIKVANEVISLDITPKDTLKIAAGLTDKSSVDKVLSLNYFTNSNIRSFKDAVPDLEDTLNTISSLVIAGRMGEIVDPVPAKAAMEELADVIGQLRELDDGKSKRRK